MRNRNGRPWVSTLGLNGRMQLTGQSFDDACAEAWLRIGQRLGRANAVVADRQGPADIVHVLIDEDPAIARPGKRMFERVDDQVGDDQSQAHRDVGIHAGAVGGHRDRHLVMIVDHRGAQAFAQLAQIFP